MKWQLFILLGVLMATTVTATNINLLEEQHKTTLGLQLGKYHYVITVEDSIITEAHLDLKNEITDYELNTDKETIYSLAKQLPFLTKEERIYLVHKKLGIPFETLDGMIRKYQEGGI